MQSKGLSGVFSGTTVQKHPFFGAEPFMIQLSHLYMTARKAITLNNIWTFVSKVMSLLFNMLSRFVIAFIPKSKHLLVSWLQSLSAVILEPKKIKSATVSSFPHLFKNFPQFVVIHPVKGCGIMNKMHKGKMVV